MIKKTICDCGHEEITSSVERVGSSTYCKKCWRHHMSKKGRYDKGCVMPTTVVCLDRDPVQINPLSPIPPSIKCYRGHKICADKHKHVLSNFRTNDCPMAGCGLKLSVTITMLAKVYTCPRHGVVYRAIIKPREDE